MATLTKAQLADRILENLQIKAAGQTSTAADSALVEEALDSAHDRLRKEGLAPFHLTSIPMWAQAPLRDWVSAELVNVFGIGGERAQLLLAAKSAAEEQLARQTSTGRQSAQIRPDWF